MPTGVSLYEPLEKAIDELIDIKIAAAKESYLEVSESLGSLAEHLSALTTVGGHPHSRM